MNGAVLVPALVVFGVLIFTIQRLWSSRNFWRERAWETRDLVIKERQERNEFLTDFDWDPDGSKWTVEPVAEQESAA